MFELKEMEKDGKIQNMGFADKGKKYFMNAIKRWKNKQEELKKQSVSA